jgi:penicillin amidase
MGMLAAGAYLFARGLIPEPRKTGNIVISGLAAEVTIVRDIHGVPHIYARSAEDAYLGLGFVHSQDRRLQMEFTRRYLRGELAEMTGPASLPSDRLMRTLGIFRYAEAEVASLTSEDRGLLEAYAAGVNAAAVQAGWPRWLLSKILNINNKIWTIEDSLAILKLDAVSYTQLDERLLIAALIEEVGVDELHWFIISDAHKSDPGILSVEPSREGHFDRNISQPPLSDVSYNDYLDTVRSAWITFTPGVGSNSWVIGGERSATGLPLLASDPHMRLWAPSPIYAAHLVAPGIHVIGVGIPGLPAFHHGHNDRIAWGITLAGTESQDLFIEQLDDSNRNVLTPTGWVPLEGRAEEIRVRGHAKPTLHQARASPHGPLISDASVHVVKGVGGSATQDHAKPPYALAVASTALKPNPAGWYFALARARNWTEFREALRSYSGPGYSFLYADVDGNIGFQLAARVPLREGLVPTVPIAGWEQGHEWIGEIPFDHLPSIQNPKEGLIATANSRVTGPAYPYHLSGRWADLPWRVNRIRDLIGSRPKLTLADMRGIQLDIFQRSMADVVAWTKMADSKDPVIHWFQNKLADWDLKASRDSPEQPLAEAFRLELLNEVFRTRLSPKLLEAYTASPLVAGPALGQAMQDPDAKFFGTIPEEAVKRRSQVVTEAIWAAMRRLEEKFGTDRSHWTWGQTHTSEFQSVLGQGSGIFPSLIRHFAHVGSLAVPGSNTTVNLSYRPKSNIFNSVYGPGYRQLVDLGDLSRSLYLPPPPGQSESWGSSHYRDLAQPWVNGEYFPMAWTDEQVKDSTENTLLLEGKR